MRVRMHVRVLKGKVDWYVCSLSTCKTEARMSQIIQICPVNFIHFYLCLSAALKVSGRPGV